MKAGPKLYDPAAPLGDVAHGQAPAVARAKAERAAQREGRIELGLGRTDLGAFGRRVLLGRAHVRPTTQQVRRDADRHLERRLRNRAGRPEEVAELAGRQAKQYAQRVASLLELDIELRRLRLRLGQLRLRLLDIALAGLALPEARLSDGETALLELDVVAHDAHPLLVRADVDVGAGDIGEQRDQGVVIIGDAGGEPGVGRFDGAADLAPEVDLPGGADPNLTEPEGVVPEAGQQRVAPAHVHVGELAARLLLLRIEVADRDAELGPCLEHPHGRPVQRQVLPVGGVDQPVESRIVQRLPPGRICRFCTDPRIARLDPA